MPCPQKQRLVFFNQIVNPPDLGGRESRAPFKPHGIEPKLGGTVIPLNMYVWRFRVIR
jgi:hypothetical protein